MEQELRVLDYSGNFPENEAKILESFDYMEVVAFDNKLLNSESLRNLNTLMKS